LESNFEFEEYKEGGVNGFVHKLPIITKHPNLVLKKGMTDSNTMYKWYKDVTNGNIRPSQISVILFDNLKNVVKRWTFQNAFPIKWSASSFNSTSNSLEIETVEIVHQGFLLQEQPK
jgi:phage tail-like protein